LCHGFSLYQSATDIAITNPAEAPAVGLFTNVTAPEPSVSKIWFAEPSDVGSV
jgi:hypothetical protein